MDKKKNTKKKIKIREKIKDKRSDEYVLTDYEHDGEQMYSPPDGKLLCVHQKHRKHVAYPTPGPNQKLCLPYQRNTILFESIVIWLWIVILFKVEILSQ